MVPNFRSMCAFISGAIWLGLWTATVAQESVPSSLMMDGWLGDDVSITVKMHIITPEDIPFVGNVSSAIAGVSWKDKAEQLEAELKTNFPKWVDAAWGKKNIKMPMAGEVTLHANNSWFYATPGSPEEINMKHVLNDSPKYNEISFYFTGTTLDNCSYPVLDPTQEDQVLDGCVVSITNALNVLNEASLQILGVPPSMIYKTKDWFLMVQKKDKQMDCGAADIPNICVYVPEGAYLPADDQISKINLTSTVDGVSKQFCHTTKDSSAACEHEMMWPYTKPEGAFCLDLETAGFVAQQSWNDTNASQSGAAARRKLCADHGEIDPDDALMRRYFYSSLSLEASLKLIPFNNETSAVLGAAGAASPAVRRRRWGRTIVFRDIVKGGFELNRTIRRKKP